MLAASPVDGTSIVSLKARGGEPTFLKAFLDRLVAAYQVSISERYKSASSDAIVQVRDEAKKLGDSVVAKRKDADEFRAKYNIVSLERDENQVLSEVKGNATALNAANDKVIAAEARLNALQDAQAAGQSVTRSKDNPTLASLEQQAASIRADLKEVARTFTPQYMAIDPRVKSMRERLIEIEQQMVQQRQASQQGALQEAKEELAGARSASAALKKQLANNQQSVQSFTSRFNEYKGMQEEVVRIEQLRQKAVERQAALEAEESARVPKVEVLEPAATPYVGGEPAVCARCGDRARRGIDRRPRRDGDRRAVQSSTAAAGGDRDAADVGAGLDERNGDAGDRGRSREAAARSASSSDRRAARAADRIAARTDDR